MQATKDHLTEDEKRILALFRELDERGRRRVILAAESVKATAERERNPFAF